MRTTPTTRWPRLARPPDRALDIGWFEEPVPPEDLARLPRGQGGADDPDRRRRMRIHALRLPRLLAARAWTSPSPTPAPREGSPNARRSPTWRRPSASATSRMSGAPVSRSPPRCSSSPCCRTTRPALAPTEPLLEFDLTEHPIRQAILNRADRAGERFRAGADGPGLGIEIDRAALERFAVQ